MLNIHPDECIDCGACVPACPVEAIFALDEVPEKWKGYIQQNADVLQEIAARRAGAAETAVASPLSRLRSRGVGAAARRHAADARRSRPGRAAGPQRARVASPRSRRSTCRSRGCSICTSRRRRRCTRPRDTFLGQLPSPHAVRHRRRRQRGGGQEHVRAHPAGAARRAGPRTRASISSRPTAFSCPIACSRRAACSRARGFPRATTCGGSCSSWPTSRPASGAVHAPVYSHQAYDIVPGEFQVVDRPDIVIVEGLNVLQTGDGAAGPARAARSCRTSSISRSTSTPTRRDIEAWYIERFLALRETVFRDPHVVLPPLRGARRRRRRSRRRATSGGRSTA